MRQIILSLLVTCVLQSKAQSSDTIYWSPYYKLEWNDFKGIPNSSNANDALSSIQIRYKLVPTDSGYSFFVYCFFLKANAWSKTNSNSFLLNHEQRHFDIAEIFARKLRREFQNYNSTNKQKITADFRIIFNKIMSEWDFFQKKWDQKIDNELYLLKKFVNK
jgi:hypothetical protein